MFGCVKLFEARRIISPGVEMNSPGENNITTTFYNGRSPWAFAICSRRTPLPSKYNAPGGLTDQLMCCWTFSLKDRASIRKGTPRAVQIARRTTPVVSPPRSL